MALANTRRARESFHQAFERRIQGSAQPGSDAQRDSGGALESQPPSGNVEYAPAEMKKNGVEVVHLATGLLVGYPPCPHIEGFCGFIEAEYGIEVVLGAHPVPQNYFETHEVLGTSNGPGWQSRLEGTLTDERTRRSYGRNSQRGKQP